MNLEHRGSILLETKRLFLKKINKDNYQDLYNYLFGNREVCERANLRYFETITKMKKVFNKAKKYYNKINNYSWIIFLKEECIPIGVINIHSQEDNMFCCQVGYAINYNYYNQGYATEALKQVIHYLFNKVGYNRIKAKHIEGNKASGRVMEKAGMKFEGIERESFYHNGIFMNKYLYGIIRSDLMI